MIEKLSPTWKKTEAWASEMLIKLRTQNDNPKLDAVQTAVIRGKISAIKELLALPEEKPDAQVKEAEPYI